MRTDSFINYLANDEMVKRIKELEIYIDSNTEIKDKFKELKDIQKKMVNAKEANQTNQYKQYKDLYDNTYEELLDYPFLEEYLELLSIVNNELNNSFKIIEDIINKKINED